MSSLASMSWWSIHGQPRASRRVRAKRYLRRKVLAGRATLVDAHVVFVVLVMSGLDRGEAGRQVGEIMAHLFEGGV